MRNTTNKALQKGRQKERTDNTNHTKGERDKQSIENGSNEEEREKNKE
jgi:hypothetical protein